MLLDIGLSLIYVKVFAEIFSVELSGLYVALSVFFGLLPDIDTPIELLQRGRIGGKVQGFHRELTHYPLLYIPLIIFAYFYFGIFWFSLLTINIVSHFIHNSVWTGWGIKWLAPFSQMRYKFFADSNDGEPSTNFVARWTPQELEKVSAEFGNDNWFKEQYLSLSPILLTDLAVLLIGIAVLLLL
ncbi:MAG: metal-dependent hydrolase [Patescibacteria group bacterium]